MKAESFVRAPWAAERWLRRASLPAWAGPLVTGVYLASVALLVQRRLAGALVEPLRPGSFLVTTVALLLLAAWTGSATLARQRKVHRTTRVASLERVLTVALLTLALLGILALAVPGTSAWALGTATGASLLTAIGVLARDWYLRRAAPGPARQQLPRPRQLAPRKIQLAPQTLPQSTTRPVLHKRPAPSLSEIGSTANDDSHVVQHLVRRQNSTSGGQRFDGWLRCDFSPGQRTAALHVAFCPPLAALPTVEARIDPQQEVDATCKVAELYVHGARFEVRLASPARQSTTTRVIFSAVAAQTAIANSDAANINDAANGAPHVAVDR